MRLRGQWDRKGTTRQHHQQWQHRHILFGVDNHKDIGMCFSYKQIKSKENPHSFTYHQ